MSYMEELKDKLLTPRKNDKRVREYYDGEHHCFVREEMTTSLSYEPHYLDKSTGIRGWWVYRTEFSYIRSPVSNPPESIWGDRDGYERYINSLPKSKTTVVVAEDDPWISDAAERRKRSKAEQA